MAARASLSRGDRSVLQHSGILPTRLLGKSRRARSVLQSVRGVRAPRSIPRCAPQLGGHLSHEPPLQRRLRVGGVRDDGRGVDLVRRWRVGARISTRSVVQEFRVVFHPPTLSRAALSRGPAGVRAADHPQQRDAGNLPRRWPHARRRPASGQDRAPRLRTRGRARPRGPCAHVRGAGRHQLRSCNRRPDALA